MADPTPVIEAAAEAVAETPVSNEVFIAYTALLTMALICVHVGAHLSLNPFDHDGERKGETVDNSDARWFPVIGSVMLISLYVLVKIFGKDILNYVLMVYFGFVGTIALASSMSDMLIALFPSIRGTQHYHYSVKIPFMNDPLAIDFTREYFVSTPIAVAVVAAYIVWKQWILNNILAIAFAIQGVERINLGGFAVGAILLGGLFIYDIFWVFATDVMVTVAKSVDWPIKLVFPRAFGVASPQLAMLGLGDIVIPGIFIALMLRYDVRKGTNKAYYKAVYVAYVVAVVTALVIMHTFQAAQPVLLYIVPMCLGTVAVFALIRGEFMDVVTFKEEEEVKESTHPMETRSQSIRRKEE